MRRFLFVYLILCSQGFALDLNEAYQEGAATGTSHANQPIDLLKALDLNQFPGYQENLPQEQYYKGVTQDTTGLEADSQAAIVNNESGKAVSESFNHRPLYQVNPSSEAMQKLNQIAENGDAIIRGQNTDKTTCSLKPKECHYSWQEKICLSSKVLGELHCARHLRLEVSPFKEYWDDQCQHLQNKEKEGLCHLTEPLRCTDPNQTRVIGEVPFTRPCWKETASYRCSDEKINTCDVLISQGCEQTTSTCVKEEADHCTTYQQTYQCPINQCTDNQLLCGEESFCLDGNCAKQEYSPANEDDFKKAMSTLSASSDASKDFDANANFIFKGQLLECSKVMLKYKNCCSDSGWGVDLELAHCSDAEKKLGKAREDKLIVPTGEYCYKRRKFPGGSVCTDRHETYCVFQSKLARMVQEQGRRDQLHISFGQANYSNCSGITPEQMQLIHFEKIDFSEFYNDVKNKIKQPDYQQTANGISQRLKEFYNQGDING